MLKTATSVGSEVQDESVVTIWNLTAHYLNRRRNDLLHIASHSLRIIVAFAVDHDAMRHSLNFERYRLETADFHGRVIKNVKVFGAESIVWTALDRQSCSNLPRFRCQD